MALRIASRMRWLRALQRPAAVSRCSGSSAAAPEDELKNMNAKISATMQELERMRAAKMQVEDKIRMVHMSQEKYLMNGSAESGSMIFKSTSMSSLSSMADPGMALSGVVRAWDGCMAASHVAYAMSEDAFIFPITPSSPMAEIVEAWSVAGTKNIFGGRLNVQQMQSEGGAAGAVHGSIAAGGLATTFTSSQGLLLMIPNMYKIAGELMPCVFHVAARAIAGEALSIFGDHQDVMAARATGWAMVGAQNVQDSMDLGLCAHLATLKARVPVVAFQDGFRTSHEINTINVIDTDDMRDLLDKQTLQEHRARGLSPLDPKIRGSNQNPDVYMQCLESSNVFYDRFPHILQGVMNDVSAKTGRPLSLFRYAGHPEAEHVIIQMGSAVAVTNSILEHAYMSRGAKVAVVSPILFRPWAADAFLEGLPHTTKTITVLDRTKESGSYREPLFLDVAASVQQDARFSGVRLLGGRFGLGSKEYTPAMALAVVDNALSESPKDRFTVGIEDDVTFSSLQLGPPNAAPQGDETNHCVFFGLAGDGTVGANKNAVKIIGDNTDLKAQAYFAYSSVKAGTATVSHMRFGSQPIDMPYLILPDTAKYVACSFTRFVEVLDMLQYVKPGAGTFVLNCPWDTVEKLEENLPAYMKRQIAQKNVDFYTLDASRVANDVGLGKLTNNIMQTAFFKLSGVLDFNRALGYFREAIKKSYKKRGDAVIERNLKAVDEAISNLIKVEYPASWATLPDLALPETAKFEGLGDFVQNVQSKMVMLQGDDIPVSAFPLGGETPMGLSNNEKRTPAEEVPEVDMDKCTQCNYCAYVCPHAVIRPFLMDQQQYDAAPVSLEARKSTASELAGRYYRIQVSAQDCTGCEVCVKMCPDDALRMVSQEQVKDLKHHDHWNYLRALPVPEDLMKKNSVKGSQMQQPLLEFSAACAGCGETPYVKLLTQMFGDRMVIANATGCSSIWGNPYGSAPYVRRDSDGKGPAWQNSLFEDNAEFGFGMLQGRLTRRARLHDKVGEALQKGLPAFSAVPELHTNLKLWHDKWESASTSSHLADALPLLLDEARAKGAKDMLFEEIDAARDGFVKTSQWIIGGDGWAYDIGFGGLDHVLASGANVNVLVLDTESYSNTGGQKSKSTPGGSIAKFAMNGKERQKKSLGDIMMSYGDIYVASISMGAQPAQAVKAFAEAEEYSGPSLIVAYAPCIEFKIAHQDGLGEMLNCQKLAVSSGYWPLYRYDPRLEPPMQLDQKTVKDDLSLYLQTEDRFNALKKSNPDKFQALVEDMRHGVTKRHARYTRLATSESTAEGPPLTILYGSETGNTAELAARFAGQCRNRGYAVELSALDDLSVEDLQDKTNVVIMIATCGEGQLPQNARTMWEELGRAEPGALSGVNYTVFALGDKAYRHFCSAGKDFDEKFEELGAKRLQNMGIGDDKDEDKFETGFADWLPEYWQTVDAPEDPMANEPPQPLFELGKVAEKDVFPTLAPPPGTRALKMNFNKRITSQDYGFSIRHIQYESPDGVLPWLLGDALAIHSTNDAARVAEFLRGYGIDGDECLAAVPLEGADAGRKAEQLERPFRVSSLFEELLDLFGRPTKNFLHGLSKIAPEGSEDAKKLAYLVSDEGKEAFTKEISAECLTFAEVLLKFPSAKPDLNQLITMLPAIKPRLYTIASSTRDTPGKIDLTVITNEWDTASGATRRGLCTDYFERTDTDSGASFNSNCSITPGTFQFGAPEVPMVMTGTGTGIAPFLAFAKERDWLIERGEKNAGEMWLFYGCRNRSEDYILGDDLEALSEKGVLTHLRPAFSRDGPKKVYIQDRIKQDAEGVYSALVEKRGYLYLCGQAGDREKDLLESVKQAFIAGGKISPELAQKELDALIDEGRYCPELY